MELSAVQLKNTALLCDITGEPDALLFCEPADSNTAFLEITLRLLVKAAGINKSYDIRRVSCSMVAEYIKLLTGLGDLKLDAAFWSSEAGLKVLAVFPVKAKEHDRVFPAHYSNLAHDAFQVEYQKADTIPLSIILFAHWCLSNWNHQIYYSLYAAVVNASMIGKSRAFAQLASLGIFVFTISFQSESSANLPPRSVIIADWLSKGDCSSDHEVCKAQYAAFLVVAMERLLAFVKANITGNFSLAQLAEHWAGLQRVEGQGFWKGIIDDVATSYSDGTRELSINETNAMVVDGAKKRKLPGHAEFGKLGLRAAAAQDELKKLLSSRYPESGDTLVKTIFFFDEAAELASQDTAVGQWTRFQVLRRSLRVLSGSNCCFAFFADTVSKISNFAPATRWERSSRLTVVGLKLYPAFWWLPTMDVWPEARGGTLTLRQWEHPFGYFRFGRPAYFAHLGANPEAREVSAEARDSLDLLGNKLMDAVPAERNSVTPEQALAILGVRTTLTVTASCHLAKTLTSNHMRLCVGVSEDRESVYSFQYPEPALALAATRLIAIHGWSAILDHLRQVMSSTFTDAGNRGELGAQIMLLMAADRLMIEALYPLETTWQQKAKCYAANSWTIPTIRLGDFLRAILDKKNIDQLLLKDQLSERVSRMYIRLVQFVKVFVKPGKKQLCEMFKRANGIMVMTGAKDVDIIIPVLVLSDTETLDTVIPVPERMSVLLVQVKCYSTSRSTNAEAPLCSVHLTRDTSTANGLHSAPSPQLDYVSLLMEVGPHASGKHRCTVFSRQELSAIPGMTPPFDPKQLSIAINGMRPSAILSKDNLERLLIDEPFQKLMTERYDPLQIKENKGQALESLKMNLGLLYDS